MSVDNEASRLLRAIVSPQGAGESVKSLISRAARETGLTAGRVKKLWYGEACAILATEMDAIRAAAARRSSEARNAMDDNYQALLARVAALEAQRARIDRLLDRLGDLSGGPE